MPINFTKFLSVFHRALLILKLKMFMARQSSPEKVLIVVITSNRGLCGAFKAMSSRKQGGLSAEKYPDQYRNGNLWTTDNR